MSTPLQLTIAVDPGATGGIAVRFCGQEPYAWPMPDTDGDLRDEIEALTERADKEKLKCVAYVEKVGGYVAGVRAPGSAMFRFGEGYGYIRGVLDAHRWEVRLVRPQAWQKLVGLGTKGKATRTEWKARLRAEAQRRFPRLKVTNAVADALLLLDVSGIGGGE